MPEIIYFELNNWSCGCDYPDAEPFVSWMQDDLNIKFNDEQWVKDNELCVVRTFIDMSQNFCITATKEWVEKNCPELLAKYNNFIRQPDIHNDVYGRFGSLFLPYIKENIGTIKWDDDE